MIFVVKGVVVFLRHEDGKQVFIRPFAGVADRVLPRGVVAYLATDVAIALIEEPPPSTLPER